MDEVLSNYELVCKSFRRHPKRVSGGSCQTKQHGSAQKNANRQQSNVDVPSASFQMTDPKRPEATPCERRQVSRDIHLS